MLYMYSWATYIIKYFDIASCHSCDWIKKAFERNIHGLLIVTRCSGYELFSNYTWDRPEHLFLSILFVIRAQRRLHNVVTGFCSRKYISYKKGTHGPCQCVTLPELCQCITPWNNTLFILIRIRQPSWKGSPNRSIPNANLEWLIGLACGYRNPCWI